MKLTQTKSGRWIAEHKGYVAISDTRLGALRNLARILWRNKK